MKKRPYDDYNAQAVLERVERYIEGGRARPIDMIYDDLSIFDWWPETLSIKNAKAMAAFIKEAIKLGYTGYVCFKVGASGCANGMWAYPVPTTDGYSPDSDFLYRSFSPDYTYWCYQKDGETYPDRDHYDDLKNVHMLEKAIAGKAPIDLKKGA